MQLRVGFVGGVLGCLLAMGELYAPPALAEAATAPAAPDLVLLKDGGMLRGTIAETKPGEFVSILMISGELRKVPFEQVSYAGPSAGAPNATPPAPPAAPQATAPTDSVRPLITVEGPEAKVRFESSPVPITLTRRSDSAGLVGRGAIVESYSEICTAPCRVSLPAGSYNFGGSVKDRTATSSDAVTLPAGESVLHAEYTDNRGLRIGGVVLLSVGVLGGTLLATDALIGHSGPCDEFGYCPQQTNSTELALGSAALAVGLIGGLVLIAQHDKLAFTVSPGAAAPPRALGHGFGPTDRNASASVASELSGLHVTAVF